MTRLLMSLLVAVFALSSTTPIAQVANGKLQIHFMDVGQGDGALLISPLGETVLFDDGVRNLCDKPLSYLQQLGVTSVKYHIASHYHDDHIGCAAQVFADFPLTGTAFDRGGTYPSGTFTAYLSAVGSKRQAVSAGQRVTLDATSTTPVFIDFVALSGDGVTTQNENDLSLVAVVRFGGFDAEIGGDLSGFHELDYEDIETSVAPKVGQVEVYKVHHHGSRYSSNQLWLQQVHPKVGIISAGLNSKHGHPTAETIERLHNSGVQLFWTSDGGGVDADSMFDVVGGNIIVEASPAAQVFTVRTTIGGNQPVREFSIWGGTPTPPVLANYAWSKKSSVYHVSTCVYVKNISAENLETGTAPPAGKTLHQDCPK